MTASARRLPFVALTLVFSLAGIANAQGQGGPPAPRDTVNVNVVGGTVGVTGSVGVTGNVGVTGTVAATQSGEWVTRSAADPYTESLRPTCPFANQCVATFTAVPAGYILRVTSMQGWVQTSSGAAQGLVGLHLNDASGLSALFIVEAPSFGAAYYGPVIGVNQKIDIVFTAGQVPVIEVGVGASSNISNVPFNRLGITGTLLPAPNP